MKKQLMIVAAFCFLSTSTAAVAASADHGLCTPVTHWHWLDWLPCHG
jgi:hypothetical protein